MRTREVILADIQKIDDQINDLYWTYTRCKRGKPPVVVRPDLYERRRTLRTELRDLATGNRICDKGGPVFESQLQVDRFVLSAIRDLNATGVAARASAIWERGAAAAGIGPRNLGERWSDREIEIYNSFGSSTQRLKRAGLITLRTGPGYGWVHNEFAHLLTVTEGVPVSTAQNVISNRTVALKDLWLEAAPHWTNPREFSGLDAGELREMGESIKTKGIVDAVKVQKILVNGAVHDLVIDGQRRVMAGREVLPKGAPIPVVDLSEEPMELTPENCEKLLLLAFTTYEREGLSSYEISGVAERLAKRGKTGKLISAIVGKSESWISRMLKARSTATPQLLLKWRKGDVTDEQFKDLAAETDPEKQADKTKDVVEARKSGDKTEARTRAKEVAETAKAAKKPAKNDKPTVPPAVSGKQQDIFTRTDAPDPKPTPAKDDKPKMRSRAVLDDMLHMAEQKPPTSDIVKGIMMGVKYTCGIMEAHEFGKAWDEYVRRASGAPKPAKKSKPTKPPKAKSAKKAAKAKPAKKSKGKK